MRQRLLTIPAGLVAATLLCGALAGCESKPPTANVPTDKIGQLMAASLPNLKGEVNPLSDYKGRGGLVLLFVDTSCPYSGSALQELPTVRPVLAQHGVNCLVVNGDEDKSVVQEFYAKNNPGSPVVYDPGATTRNQWNVTSVPVAVYITPDNKVGYQGLAKWADMGAGIEKSLGLAAGTLKFSAPGTGYG